MDDRFSPNEYLYRGLHPMWVEADNTVSSAAFKDKNGISVDRGGDRKEQECIDRLFGTLSKIKGVCKLTCGDVEDCDAITKYLPLSDNEFHSEIHDSEDQVQIRSKSKSRNLARKSQIVFKKED